MLIALAVIFVPMVLDGPVEQEHAPRSTGVPLALPEPLPVQAEETSPPAPTPVQRPAPTPVQLPEPTPVQLPEPTPATAGETPGFYVQLGAFSENARAEGLASRVRSAGFDAFVQRAVMQNGTLYRVRIGPIAERAAADTLAARVSRAVSERAVVVEHP